ncbi:TIGR02234 family membrane protein [Alloalcanivorax gelatiniphagus]
MAEPPRPRRTFGPVVLLGVAGAGLAAVAGNKPWVSGSSGAVDTDVGSSMALGSLDGARDSPLAGALALAVLACWGVLLVTRGRFRRAVAVLALVGSVGLLVVCVEAAWSLPDKLTDALLELSGTDTASTGYTGWYAAALAGAVLCVLATLGAAVLARSWPEMGSRYDAPVGAPVGESDATPDNPDHIDNIDLWKALDEGRDPTA